MTLRPGRPLTGQFVQVPGDISSAAFFLVAGAVTGNGAVTVRGVGVNPTRTGALDVLQAMGADLTIAAAPTGAEPTADVTVRGSRLRGTSIGGGLVPRTIDEIPILAVAAACADGVTEVRDAAELRVKESDRIRALGVELAKMGVEIEERADGFRIRGGRRLRGARVASWGDHRLAMALVVAGLVADGDTVVEGIDCIGTSYPEFVPTCRRLVGEDRIEVTA